MSSTDVDAIVRVLAGLLVDELNVTTPRDQIDANASLEDDLGLDSVAMVELIGTVEIEFGFEFLDSDLRTSVFKSLRSLAEVIADRLRPSTAIA